MIVNGQERHEIWKLAYIAAIGGLAAKSIPDNDVVTRAVEIANKALSEYTNEMSKKSF
ncbi:MULTISPECIES: hypothetical protein [Pseudomonas]|uniref:hypothetical protein n=1 Tax=Pseudomonas TaxID=286 RepID=UPI000A630D7B|nr:MULTISPECIES: hypothetical protein [Pseudomonas]NWB09036.1 hypothetical protein [Pseudomonas sp. D5002]NWB63204.1 hypothetical protein [Pseudomonas sp. F1002]